MIDARHQHVAALLYEHGPLAPAELRLRVEAEIAAARRRRRPRPALGARAAVGAAAASAAVAVALVLPFGGGESPPTALDVHSLSAHTPTGAAPGAKPGTPQLLAARFDGVDFPRWEPEFGWRAYGERQDKIGGRATETVFYENHGHELAYTVVGGPPLELPAGAERVRVNGVDLAEEHTSELQSLITI